MRSFRDMDFFILTYYNKKGQVQNICVWGHKVVVNVFCLMSSEDD